MYILGISAYYHDSAAIIIKDGQIVCGIEEERFSRVKHDNGFPYKSIEFCLKNQNLKHGDIDYIAYYEKPLLKFERILETFIATYPKSVSPFVKSIPEWLSEKIRVEQIIKKKLGFEGKIFFIPHHLSHAAATFSPSPFKKAAILTIDGVGEYQTTGLWLGEENKIVPLRLINFPHSLGLLYSTITSFLGYRVNNDEYKVMGLAAYGKPSLVDKIYRIVDVKKDGSFKLNLEYFSFRESFCMWSKKFERLFGKPRTSDSIITQRDKDLAASIQKVTEETYLKMLNYLYRLTNIKNLCISGGVALNAVANGLIYKNTPFENVYIFGPAGDSGNSLGAALFVYYSLFSNKRGKPVNHLYFGSSYDSKKIEKVLKKYKLKYRKFDSEDELIDKVVDLLSEGKIIGWFDGRMEFGPRALGARSILARPEPRLMKGKVNKIKRREQFRPFAGSVLEEKADHLFEVPQKNHYSPFMNFVFQVKKEKRKDVAAIVHQDGSCRIQTVNEKDNGRYYRLIKAFYKKTGIACLLNTSFNLKGEPIVENPGQAIEDFLKTKIDYLVLDYCLANKG